ncbi:MAG: hypothetical protein WC457_04960 [Patescibacteria group bacterium]
MNKKTLIEILFFGAITALILGRLLLPGYVLTLDMIFTPELRVIFSSVGLNNALPLAIFLSGLNYIFPSWVIQKIVLVGIFFCLGYLSYKFLPTSQNKIARLFCALVYAVNPFVYGRFLAGHWTHLAAYAILPVFVFYLLQFTNAPNIKSSLKLFSSIFLISLFSLHFFAMTVLTMAFTLVITLIKALVDKKFSLAGLALKYILIGGLLFLAVSAYWIAPAIGHRQAVGQRFDAQHWVAFAPAGHGSIPVWLNLLSLNGFWGEGQPWAGHFIWPQDYLVFWAAFVLIIILILIGIFSSIKYKETRHLVIFFCLLGLAAFIFSTGASDTVFKNFNVWLYENIFFWPGFRDSQKFIGLLALSYTALSGFGVATVIEYFKKRPPFARNFLVAVIFLVPIFFGYLVWGGFHGQLRSVWYPDVWLQAKQIIQDDKADYKVLFLPWHGYYSLSFNNDLIVANPAQGFFGDKSLVSRSVELDGIYDQEINDSYRRLDKMIISGRDEAIDYFIKQKIKYIIYIQDLVGMDKLTYVFLKSDRLRIVINDNRLIMYEIIDKKL